MKFILIFISFQIFFSCGMFGSKTLSIKVSNKSTHNVKSIKISTIRESHIIKNIDAGTVKVEKWELKGLDKTDGSFSTDVILQNGDSLSTNFGYYSNGYIFDESIDISISDSFLVCTTILPKNK